ncbi:MAG: heavy-metal-associated domain-containing protein [Nanoarchaeota archaeon]|nr:heavy-metal-associated domain-containing protein [Nanoarchaeota archaeon]
MKTTIYIPDMECESCAKLISKKFKNEKGIDSFTFDEEKATVEHDEGVTSKHIISMIESAGFRAGTEPYDRKTFSERWRDFNENPQKYKYEKKAIANFFYIFLFFHL